MHITVTGSLGSGKSTVCRYLSEKYSLAKYSTGDVQRELAQHMGMTTLELNLYMQRQGDDHYDRMIDDEVVKIAVAHDVEDIIFDSRLAWHFVPRSFKVYLWVDPEIAAQRVFEDDKRGGVELYASVSEAAEKLKARANSENERFHAFYGIYYSDLNNYDLVIDTSAATPEEIAEIIYASARQYEAGDWETHRGIIRKPQEFH